MNEKVVLQKFNKLIEFLKSKPGHYFQKIERLIIVSIIEHLSKQVFDLEFALMKEKAQFDLLEKRKMEMDDYFLTSNSDRSFYYTARNLTITSIDNIRTRKQNNQKKIRELIEDLNFDKIKLDWSAVPNLYKQRIDSLFTTIREFDIFTVFTIVTTCESIVYRYELFNLKYFEKANPNQAKTDFANNPFYLSLVDENFIIPVSFEEYEEDIFEAMLKERKK
jgi:hypothetical protein